MLLLYITVAHSPSSSDGIKWVKGLRIVILTGDYQILRSPSLSRMEQVVSKLWRHFTSQARIFPPAVIAWSKWKTSVLWFSRDINKYFVHPHSREWNRSLANFVVSLHHRRAFSLQQWLHQVSESPPYCDFHGRLPNTSSTLALANGIGR